VDFDVFAQQKERAPEIGKEDVGAVGDEVRDGVAFEQRRGLTMVMPDGERRLLIETPGEDL